MRELYCNEPASVVGAIWCDYLAIGGAIGFAVSCIPGGPLGMLAGAALSAFRVVLYDALEIKKYSEGSL